MGTCVASYQINANIVVILSRITTTRKNVVIDYSKSVAVMTTFLFGDPLL